MNTKLVSNRSSVGGGSTANVQHLDHTFEHTYIKCTSPKWQLRARPALNAAWGGGG